MRLAKYGGLHQPSNILLHWGSNIMFTGIYFQVPSEGLVNGIDNWPHLPNQCSASSGQIGEMGNYLCNSTRDCGTAIANLVNILCPKMSVIGEKCHEGLEAGTCRVIRMTPLGASSFQRSNLASAGSLFLELSDTGAACHDEIMEEQENIAPQNAEQQTTPGSAYSEICSLAARIREVLVERNVTSTLKNGFLTPCRDQLVLAIILEFFAVSDEKFMEMFTAPEAIKILHAELLSLQKCQKTLRSCLNEFKAIAQAL
ncbi:hypothetical protein QQ045_016927 [Rhodiola kirilowii]